MDQQLEFVRLTAQNVPELCQLSRDTFIVAFAHLNKPEDLKKYLDKAFSAAQLVTEVTNPESIWYFAKHGSQTVGYLKLNLGAAQNELKDVHAMELERIYIIADQQGRGLGHKLLDKAVQEAREARAEFLWLGVWEHNLRARKLYRDYGFIEFSSHEFLLGSDVQTDILMKLELNIRSV
jgi:diamine N-acetyltransferase